MSEAGRHRTVLLQEAVTALITDPAGCYVDATFGRGGHSKAILERLEPSGRLLALDRDPEAIEAAMELSDDPRFAVKQGEFGRLGDWVASQGWQGQVMGILLDLGVSSPQLDDARRGFSFSQDGPLDMRMDPASGESAADWLARAAEKDIADVLWRYGEERYSRRMARAIVAAREERALQRTGQLAEIVAAANPAWERGKHPATRAFQAIRIYLNRELEQLESALSQALDCLRVGGRLVVISFHSLEDRLVKRFIRQQARGEQLPRSVPVTDAQLQRTLKTLGKALKPGSAELEVNPRARSAVLRVAEKIA